MSRTTLRMRVLPRFPARISGTNGVKAVRNGTSADLVLKNDFSDMIRVPAIDNPDKVFLLTWNADTNSYSIMSFNDTFAAAIDITGLLSSSGGVMTGLLDMGSNKIANLAAGTSSTDAVNKGQLAWEQIGAPIDLAGLSQVQWTNLAPFRKLRLDIHSKSNTSPSAISLRTSTNNGSTWLQGAAEYGNAYCLVEGTVITNGAITTGPSFGLSGNLSTNIGHFCVEIGEFNQASASVINAECEYFQANNAMVHVSFWGYAITGSRNALQILLSAGAFTSGNAVLEGIRG